MHTRKRPRPRRAEPEQRRRAGSDDPSLDKTHHGIASGDCRDRQAQAADLRTAGVIDPNDFLNDGKRDLWAMR
jgi:hypothetical protein